MTIATTRTPLHLAMIIGSRREGRFGGVVGRWLAQHVRERDDMQLDIIDLAEVDLPTITPAGVNDAVVDAYTRRIDEADAFVIVTPEHNHSFPASLQEAIDLANRKWRAKPVGLLSYGGIAGGVRAVEQLRQLFPELQATTVREIVSIHGAWNAFDDDGAPKERERYEAAATSMLDQLAWWASALRVARAA